MERSLPSPDAKWSPTPRRRRPSRPESGWAVRRGAFRADRAQARYRCGAAPCRGKGREAPWDEVMVPDLCGAPEVIAQATQPLQAGVTLRRNPVLALPRLELLLKPLNPVRQGHFSVAFSLLTAGLSRGLVRCKSAAYHPYRPVWLPECASFAPRLTPDGWRAIFLQNKNNCDSRARGQSKNGHRRPETAAGGRVRRVHVVRRVILGLRRPRPPVPGSARLARRRELVRSAMAD